MNLYHALLFQLNQENTPSTKHRLMTTARGLYKDIVEDCITKELIEICGKNSIGEDLYFITDKGRKFLDNPKEELK